MSTLFRLPRNAALLVFLLALIVVAPSASGKGSAYIVELVFDGILLAGVYSIGPGKHRWPFLILTVVTLAVRWGDHLAGIWYLDVGALSLTVAWLVYAVSIIIANLFSRTDVDVDTILGAVVTYLLVTVAFTLVFEIIEIQEPGSFSGIGDGGGPDRRQLTGSMMYLSLVCITTMGFGDIVPVSDIARPIAVLEGVFGQLYLAVMIARLVGLHITGRRDD
ncbi:MAG: two pore domain potassium channel family protein [Myxococcales bacterium]|nr:two pore domain potassium channel family protein [Myxococcales bacterium]